MPHTGQVNYVPDILNDLLVNPSLLVLVADRDMPLPCIVLGGQYTEPNISNILILIIRQYQYPTLTQ
jgi:hypothetical protein